MTDMRFILIGIGITFAGFLILGVMGGQYQATTFESNEFGTCFEYFEDKPPQEVNCSFKIMDQTVFFTLVIGLLGAGGIALLKGARGDWDSKVKPEDIVGPGNSRNDDSEGKQG